MPWVHFMDLFHFFCMHAQWYPTLCNPMDDSPPGSSVHGISQERTLQWVAISSSRGSSWPGTEPASLELPALAGGFFTTCTTWEAPLCKAKCMISQPYVHCLGVTGLKYIVLKCLFNLFSYGFIIATLVFR